MRPTHRRAFRFPKAALASNDRDDKLLKDVQDGFVRLVEHLIPECGISAVRVHGTTFASGV